MKIKSKIISALLFSSILSGVAFAQDPIIYPAKGQSNDQLESDKYQCYGWAKNNSGFDPMHATQPGQAQAPAPSSGGGAVGGAARGAAMGAAIGAIAGDAGKGAAIGAASGGMRGAMRRRGASRQQAQATQQSQQQYNIAKAGYDKAFAACLEGRGYTVK